MKGLVRVMLYLTAATDDIEAITRAYHQVSTDLQGTAGLVANELLFSPRGGGAVMSEWSSLTAFQAWEAGSSHRGVTSGLRPYQDGSRGRVFDIFEVAAEYRTRKKQSTWPT